MAKSDHHGVSEQRKAAVHRRQDAQVLFAGRRWRGAMYVAGYAIECLLKAQLMQKFNCETLDELEGELTKRRLMPRRQTVYTHQLLVLLQLTGGADRLRRDRDLWFQFGLVNEWIPAWRYSANLASVEVSRDFLFAVDQVSQWVRNNV